MKIAVNTRFLLPNRLEGIGRFTYETLRRMVLAHPEDTFYFFFDRAFDERYVFAKNVVPVVLYPPARHPILWYIWFEMAVKNALNRLKPDVFLSPDGYCTLETTTPTVMVLHDITYAHFPESIRYTHRKYYEHFIPKFCRRAERVVTVSEFVKRDLLDHFDFLKPEKITVCYNAGRGDFRPIDAAAQARIQQQYTEGAAYWLYVGAIHPRKNVHRLIEAFDIFKKNTGSDHKLVIVGRMAWQTDAVTEAFQKSPFQSDIVFTGFVADADLPLLTAGAFAMVYPSVFEGFGIPILEAMQCDVPVITSNLSAMPEVAGNAALYANPHDANDIAQAMQRLASDPALRSHLVAEGRIQREKFNWEKTATIVYEALKNVQKR